MVDGFQHILHVGVVFTNITHHLTKLLCGTTMNGMMLYQLTDVSVCGFISSSTKLPLQPLVGFCLRYVEGDVQMSNEKNLGWLGYIGDYTTQLYRDYNKPL